MSKIKVTAALVGFVFGSVTGSVAFASPNGPVLSHIAHNVIEQTYTDLAQNAKTLENKIATLQAQPTEANLEAAQNAWRQTRVAWESSEAFLFGPVESLGIDPMIDTWPLNKLNLDAVLNSGRQLTPDFVRNLGANLQGFHTIEYLLFGDGVKTNKKTIAQTTAREIEYMSSAAILLATYTANLEYAWTTKSNPDNPALPGYAQLISNPNLNNPVYPSEQAVFTELVKGMIGIVDEVGNGKMSDPLGANIGAANVALVESPFSWNSLTDFTNNIASVLHVYTGDYDSSQGQGQGLRAVIQKRNPALAAQVEKGIRDSMQAIQDVAGPQHMAFRQAILDPQGRVRIQTAIAKLNQLKGILKTQVLPLVSQ